MSIGVLGAAGRAADVQLALEIQRILYSDPEFLGVEVHALMGLVYLRGHAASEAVARRAEQAAARVPDAEQVRNRIRVRAPESVRSSDLEIQARIQALLAAQERPGRTLEVRVRDGNAALRGRLADADAASRLIEAIRGVPGVRSIRFDGLSWGGAGSESP